MDTAQMKAKRGTAKALLTKTRDRITEECTLEQLEVYEQNGEGYRTGYDNIQDELITGDEREAQDDYRFDIYESITGIKAQILDYKNKLLGTYASNLRTNSSSPETQTSTTSNLTFVPYQEDETFINLIKRLETFMALKGKCYRCGQENHKANVCKFRSEFCRKCNKLGHIGRVCMSQARVANYRKSHQLDDELPIQNEEYEVNVLHNAKSDKFMEGED
ncbi:hypothetical protein M8J77_000690 [Diaphorina citri]|nr:hypothetical protein M8J77_000690 [Diaphorina citri]